MEVFPAVDILSGNCVQLVGGDRLTATAYGSPIDNARRWISEGASNLHVVNLDGAFTASTANADMIREVIKNTDVFVQVGGGIRSLEDARRGEIAVSGWQGLAGDFIGWAQKFEELGAGSLLYTNLDVEGQQAGIDNEPVQKLLDAVGIPVVIAGGVTTSQDVAVLKQLGASGCVLGSALYSGRITLKEALEAAV